MSTRPEYLEESRDFWSESARSDKKQYLASFVIAATGLILVGVGIKTALSGDIPSGIVEIGLGGGLATSFVVEGAGEVQDYADTTALTAVRQSQIDSLIE